MSADRWSMCPRCEVNRQLAAAVAAAEVEAAYGKVTVEDFDLLRARADDLAQQVDNPGLVNGNETFREDYWITDPAQGEVSIKYRGRCDICGLALSFEHTHPLDVTG